MPTYTIFKDDKFKSILFTPTLETLELNLQEGDEYVEGEYPNERFYVKNSEFFSLPLKPDYPVFWNQDTEEWDWNEEGSWSVLRYDRDQKLETEVDPIVTNPLRWAALSSEKQQEYASYRQSLLDLPANTTDPRNPTWPTKPE